VSDPGAEVSAPLSSPRNLDSSVSPMDDRNPDTTMRCPTCRAVQEWADECRRCKCDLTFLRDVETRYALCRRQSLRALRACRFKEASHHAVLAHRLHPSHESERLLAVCALCRGDWVTALELARAPDLT